MSIWGLRGLLAGLLLVTLAAKIQAAHGPGRDIRATLTELLIADGRAARVEPPVPGSVFGSTITFSVPECGGRVRVIPVDLNLQESPLFSSLAGTGETWRIVYLERTWTELNRSELRLEWLQRKAQSILGLGRYAPITTALLVVGPSACGAIDGINWQAAWYR